MINQNDHDDHNDHDQRGGDSQGGSAWPCQGAEEAAGCWGAGQISLPSNLLMEMMKNMTLQAELVGCGEGRKLSCLSPIGESITEMLSIEAKVFSSPVVNVW